MMIAKMPFNIDVSVLEAMNNAIGIKKITNGYVAELPKVFDDVYEKPEWLPEGTRILAYANERFENGRAIVISGMKGERFRPTHSS
jgi:hypothetical protein